MPDGGFDPHAEQAHAATGLEMVACWYKYIFNMYIALIVYKNI